MNTELLSKLQSLNIESLTNPKTIQNVLNVMEQLARSPSPQFRQLAQTIQHRLDNNQTFQTMQKVEEIKVAEQALQQEKRVEQAHRYEQAAEIRLGEKKKEEKEKLQQLQQTKELLNSGGFYKLPVFQQLEILDYAVENYAQLDEKSQTKVVSAINHCFDSADPKVMEKAYHSSLEVMDYETKQKQNTPIDLSHNNHQALVEREKMANNTQVEALKKEDANGLVKSTNYKATLSLEIALKQDPRFNHFDLIFDKNGNPTLLKREGEAVSQEEFEQAKLYLEEIKDELGYKVINQEKAQEVFEKIHQFEEEQRKLLIEENKITNKHLAKAGISTLLANVIAFGKDMKKEGLFKEDNVELMKFGIKSLFTDVVRNNPTLNYTLHTMTKEFMKGESDALLTVPLFKEILAKENGEQILQEFFRQQTWLGNHPQIIVDKIKQAVQDPHYEQRVQQAEIENKQISLDDWNQKIVKEREQDALLKGLY